MIHPAGCGLCLSAESTVDERAILLEGPAPGEDEAFSNNIQ